MSGSGRYVSRKFWASAKFMLKNLWASEVVDFLGIMGKRISAVGKCRVIFGVKKYFSAVERYSAGAGAGAKRTSAHGRLLGGGGEKQASKRSCCSARSLSRLLEISFEGTFDGMV